MDIVERGEATLDLAAAALHVAAEDDALVTHSAVELPVQLFVTRLQRYADEIARVYLPALGPDATPEQQLAVVRNARPAHPAANAHIRHGQLHPQTLTVAAVGAGGLGYGWQVSRVGATTPCAGCFEHRALKPWSCTFSLQRVAPSTPATDDLIASAIAVAQ
jgi:hypothetical protein